MNFFLQCENKFEIMRNFCLTYRKKNSFMDHLIIALRGNTLTSTNKATPPVKKKKLRSVEQKPPAQCERCKQEQADL